MMKSKLQPILRSALLLLMAQLPTILSAHDIEVNGIFYNINGTNATVTFKGQNVNSYSNEYTGNVVIPSTVTYNGITYLVTSIGNEAFQVCQDLVSVTIPNSVTTIGDNAFSYNRGLTSVTIPNSVTTIGESAFFDCSGLTSVTIPNSVTTISTGVFCGCSGLTRVTIPNSVTSIGDLAFGGCSSLTSVTIPNSVTSIGYAAFKTCSGLINITIPNSVASIGDDAFSGCSGLTSVVLSNSVTNIRRYAFYGCSSLTSVTIPNSVLSIGESAFYGCSGLTSVTIPNSVTSIGNLAFSGCSGLTSVTIPNSVTSIGNYAFSGCSALKTLNYNAVTCADFSSGSNHPFYNLGITTIYIGSSVQKIPANFAWGLKNITSITIPNSVTSIGGAAFQNCSGLTSVTIPNSVTTIEYHAFSGCTGLINVTIGNSVTAINDFAFSGCSSLTNVTVPNSVTSIGGGAFYQCTSLTDAIIGNSVQTIGSSAFYGCENLTDLTIGTGVTSIGDQAFQGCSGLNTLNYNAISCADFYNGSIYYFSPSNLPFYNLNITTINLGANVQKIPAYFAFELTKVSELIIPNSVISIGYDAFCGCAPSKLTWNAKNCTYMGDLSKSNITQVKIGSTVEVLPSDFVSGSKITSVNLPNSLTAISDYAFSNCSALTSVSIPNSVTTIYENAFSNCYNLTDVTIGNSVNTIYRSAFAGCDKLMYVSCNAIMPPKYQPYDSYYGLFDDITYQNAILYVPDLTYGYYKQSEPWKKFMEIKAEPYADGGMAFDSKVYPTSVRIDAGDEDEECYFIFDNKQYQPLLVTGLEPNNIYSTTYTRNWGDDVPLRFYTSQLMMVPEGGKMLNATTAQLMAETNMADEETMCGFDWRRSDGPEDYLGTRSYCPVYDGKMAGTLKNLSKDTWYKFRPFYKSSAGNVYYGDWVTFYSGDWGVEFDPVVYTYQSPAVTQTDATLQGVALRGSSEITEQGFEYWKSGTSNVKKVTASGERMSATVNGLDPETSYKFRAFVTSDGKTLRGSDVEFVTRSGEHHVDNVLDVNADGIVNIADMNVVINVILRGNNDRTCDVNGDGLVNISDLNAIISSILAN